VDGRSVGPSFENEVLMGRIPQRFRIKRIKVVGISRKCHVEDEAPDPEEGGIVTTVRITSTLCDVRLQPGAFIQSYE